MPCRKVSGPIAGACPGARIGGVDIAGGAGEVAVEAGVGRRALNAFGGRPAARGERVGLAVLGQMQTPAHALHGARNARRAQRFAHEQRFVGVIDAQFDERRVGPALTRFGQPRGDVAAVEIDDDRLRTLVLDQHATRFRG